MNMNVDIRGAAPVGQLTEMSPWEADLILNLRLWMSGPRAQEQVWNAYAHSFGPKEGHLHLGQFESLLTLIDTHMARPLQRRCVGCNCLGSDEAVFLHMVHLASDGDLQEAALVATLLVRAAFAEHLALLAAEVGTVSRQMTQVFLTQRRRLSEAKAAANSGLRSGAKSGLKPGSKSGRPSQRAGTRPQRTRLH